MKCKHTQYVNVYPDNVWIHRNKMPEGKTTKIQSIVITICFDCGKILKVKDFAE